MRVGNWGVDFQTGWYAGNRVFESFNGPGSGFEFEAVLRRWLHQGIVGVWWLILVWEVAAEILIGCGDCCSTWCSVLGLISLGSTHVGGLGVICWGGGLRCFVSDCWRLFCCCGLFVCRCSLLVAGILSCRKGSCWSSGAAVRWWLKPEVAAAVIGFEYNCLRSLGNLLAIHCKFSPATVHHHKAVEVC